MEKNFLKVTKIRKYILLISVMIIVKVAGGIAGISGYYYYMVNRECKAFDQFYDQITYIEENSQKEVKGLLTYLDSTYLSTDRKGDAAYTLSRYYALQRKYEKSIRYAADAVYYYEQVGDTGAALVTGIDLAVSHSRVGNRESALRILNQVRDVLNDEIDNRTFIEIYMNINYAEIHSYLQNVEQSKKYLEKVNAILEKNEILLDKYELMEIDKSIIIIEARNLYYKQKYEEAIALLLDVDISYEYHDEIELENITLPYLEVLSKSLFHTSQIEEGTQLSDVYFTLCDKYNRQYDKLTHMKEMIDIMETYTIENEAIKAYQEEILEWYKDDMLQSYQQLVNQQTSQVTKFMFSTYNVFIEQKHNQDSYQRAVQNIKYLIIGGGVFIICFLYILVWAMKSAWTDGLTHILNRRILEYTYTEWGRKHIEFGVIMIDIDDFKKCNDTYGHQFGDHVLYSVAQVLKKKCGFYHTYRYGGEEYCIMLKNKPKQEIVELAESVRQEVQAMTWEKDIQITISLGIAVREEGEDLLKLADERLYNSKKNGKNRITFK